MSDPANPAVVDPANPNPQAVAPNPNPTPAPAAPVPEAKTDKVDPAPGNWTPTGDHGLDVAMGYFASLGLSEDSPEIQEAGAGNFAYLKAKLATMGDKAKGFEAYLNLAESSYKAFTEGNAAREAERVKLIVDELGGEEQAEAIRKWADENAEPDERAALQSMFKAGGATAKIAAFFLKSQYAGASGTSVQGADAAAGAQAAPMAATGPLTRASYTAELNKLRAQFGDANVGNTKEYAALRQRAARGFAE